MQYSGHLSLLYHVTSILHSHWWEFWWRNINNKYNDQLYLLKIKIKIKKIIIGENLSYNEVSLGYRCFQIGCVFAEHDLLNLYFYTKLYIYMNFRIKNFSFCHKLWFSNFNIVANQCRRPLIFQTMNAFRSNHVSLKYQRFTL